MKKIIFFLGVGLVCLLAFVTVARAGCEVNSSSDSTTPTTLRYILETYIYNPDTDAQNPNADCSDNTDPLDGAEQLISFKSGITTITLGTEPLQLKTLKNFVIGDSAQTVLIKGRNLSSGKSPFNCVSGSKSVYLRNLIIETIGIADIFSDESCLVQTDSVYVCDGTVNNTNVSVDGWCTGNTWPEVEDDDDHHFDFQLFPLVLCCKDEDADNYYTWDFLVLGDRSSPASRTPCRDAPLKGDCNDSEASINPGVTEISDGLDNDCDDEIDEGLTVDADGDGYDSIDTGGTDCDDANLAIYPGAAEACDDVDNNCDGVVDEESACPIVQCTDIDGDGYPANEDTCVADAYDCVDNNAEIYPGAVDTCDDGVDQNCSGSDCSVELCYDQVDNNEDGLEDCSDASCVSYAACNGLTPEISCVDGLDDDGDTLLDCADADCANLGVCTGVPETECQDDSDNDGDGDMDCADTDCYNVVYDALTGAFCPEGGVSDPPATYSSGGGCGCYLGAAGTVSNFSSVFLGLMVGFGMVVARIRKR